MWEGQIDYGSYNGKDGKNLGYCITLMMVSPIDPGKIYISLFSKGIQILLKQSEGELYMSRYSGLGNESSLEYNCHPYCFFGNLHTIEKRDCLGLSETPSQILLALNLPDICALSFPLFFSEIINDFMGIHCHLIHGHRYRRHERSCPPAQWKAGLPRF